jgi:hypothetical protein
LETNKKLLLNSLFSPLNEVLLPPLSSLLRSVTLWTDYYSRWSEFNKLAQNDFTVFDGILSDIHLQTQGDCVDLFEIEYLKERARRETLEETILELRKGLAVGRLGVSDDITLNTGVDCASVLDIDS